MGLHVDAEQALIVQTVRKFSDLIYAAGQGDADRAGVARIA